MLMSNVLLPDELDMAMRRSLQGERREEGGEARDDGLKQSKPYRYFYQSCLRFYSQTTYGRGNPGFSYRTWVFDHIPHFFYERCDLLSSLRYPGNPLPFAPEGTYLLSRKYWVHDRSSRILREQGFSPPTLDPKIVDENWYR
jgi:hypothetical protein